MRVLVTGTSGRVGAAIAEKAKQTANVIGLDRVTGRHTTVVGDITDNRLVKAVLHQVDAVIHTAALHAPHIGKMTDADFWHTNVKGTEILLEAACRAGVRRFVYTSSTSVYGDALLPQGKAVWVTENLPPIPRDIYDETKLAAEHLCQEAAQDGLKKVVVLRMSRCFPEPADQIAIYRLYRGVDIRDVAKAHVLALSVTLSSFELFNISAASPFSIEDCEQLQSKAHSVIVRYYPWAAAAFAAQGWTLPHDIDRVINLSTTSHLYLKLLKQFAEIEDVAFGMHNSI